MQPPTAASNAVVEVADPLVYKFGLEPGFLILLVAGARHHRRQTQLYLPVQILKHIGIRVLHDLEHDLSKQGISKILAHNFAHLGQHDGAMGPDSKIPVLTQVSEEIDNFTKNFSLVLLTQSILAQLRTGRPCPGCRREI